MTGRRPIRCSHQIGLAFSESGWIGTAKREAFCALLDDVHDWPLAAAIRVLAEVALREPDTTSEVRLRLMELAPRMHGERNRALVFSLFLALDMLPNVPREAIEALRSQLSEQPGESDVPVPPHAPKRESTSPKRPWWKFWGSDLN